MPQFVEKILFSLFWTRGEYRKGLTLMEVLIALMIFSMGILAVLSMQSHGMRGTAGARQGLNDTTAMVKHLELLMTLGYDHEQLADNDSAFDPQHPDHGPVTIPRSFATLEWEVGDDLPVPGTKRVQVTLRHPGGSRATGSVSFICIKADDMSGLED